MNPCVITRQEACLKTERRRTFIKNPSLWDIYPGLRLGLLGQSELLCFSLITENPNNRIHLLYNEGFRSSFVTYFFFTHLHCHVIFVRHCFTISPTRIVPVVVLLSRIFSLTVYLCTLISEIHKILI